MVVEYGPYQIRAHPNKTMFRVFYGRNATSFSNRLDYLKHVRQLPLVEVLLQVVWFGRKTPVKPPIPRPDERFQFVT
jgi:hypothetical protein